MRRCGCDTEKVDVGDGEDGPRAPRNTVGHPELIGRKAAPVTDLSSQCGADRIAVLFTVSGLLAYDAPLERS